jgi:hypothetical protein
MKSIRRVSARTGKRSARDSVFSRQCVLPKIVRHALLRRVAALLESLESQPEDADEAHRRHLERGWNNDGTCRHPYIDPLRKCRFCFESVSELESIG